MDCSSSALGPHPRPISLASTRISLGVQEVAEGTLTVMEGSSTVQEAAMEGSFTVLEVPERSSTVQEAPMEGSSTVLSLLHQQLEDITEQEKSRPSQEQVRANGLFCSYCFLSLNPPD